MRGEMFQSILSLSASFLLSPLFLLHPGLYEREIRRLFLRPVRAMDAAELRVSSVSRGKVTGAECFYKLRS